MSSKALRVYSGKRKNARASATIRPGTGVVRYNGFLLEALPENIRMILSSPIKLAGDRRFKVDLDITAEGGGVMSQAYAAAVAVSRALVDYFKDEKDIREVLLSYDRHLLIGDERRKEPKKFGGPGARRREQKSYR